ncbi:hypothetical protein GNI_066500 [Gregarina niphandrodes]|uniref:Armadillo/beta-catenin-like repeat protein n=1 Tax=Gregarina niphandrodes TaxID=110365 RepID=A0A023B7R5_GRENI|nr:hypothetical protein GNI_066500 [Gregarina niphandrodes]EZG67689.1 hypothetical protein GNI_066500 [Gregarina niphandrodes]|eukprot:XP_011130161.1 hypothetical protein GNI_066500 [Gregarina niphandrodes]
MTQEEADALTLRDVYGYLMKKLNNEESLEIKEDRPVRRLWRFLVRKTSEYGRDQDISVTSNEGSEFMFGCMCLQILGGCESNRAAMTKAGVVNLLLGAMHRQRDEQVAQHAVLTSLELAQYAEFAEELASTDAKRKLLVSMVERARACTQECVYDDVEDLVGPRVQLLERTALTVETYNDTDALEQVLEAWNDYDYYFYGKLRVHSAADLQALQKSDRKTKSPNKLGRRASLARRASQLFRRKERNGSDLSDASSDLAPSTAATPLERRRSVVSPPAPEKASPLERRKSVVSPDALGQGSPAKGSAGAVGADQQSGGLIRRASQMFMATPSPKRDSTKSPLPANVSIAHARRQSLGCAAATAPIQRRASFFARKTPEPTAVIKEKDEKEKASYLMRRASMAPDTVDVQAIARKISLGSDVELRSTGMESAAFDCDTVDFDQQQFVSHMLEHVMRALRKLANPSNFAELFRKNVPLRLVGLVVDTETPPAAFSDVLYLIGSTAGHKLESGKLLKDLYCEYKAVDSIVSLIKRAYKQKGAYVSETITNGCLALAALVVVHLPNIRRFQKHGGVFLLVDLINVRGSFNDSSSVNGASALVCNLCFKNPDMKGSLGAAGACAALTTACQLYESEGGLSSSRNIASLFRAIGNLALNQDNMQRFLDARIDRAFASFLGQVDDELDATTVESSLRTLSNLAIERDNMEIFQIVIVPFLSLLRKERHDYSNIHKWAFDTLANLCRLPENAQVFCRNAGVETIFEVLPYLDKNTHLWASVIHVLGIQTTHEPNVRVLLDAEVFAVLDRCLKEFKLSVKKDKQKLMQLTASKSKRDPGELEEDGNGVKSADDQNLAILQLSQMPVSGMRCAHRLLKSKTAAELCIQSGVFTHAMDVLSMDLKQQMLSYECLRVILATIAHLRGPDAKQPEDYPVLAATHVADESDPFLTDGWGASELQSIIAGNNPLGYFYSDPTKPAWRTELGAQVYREEREQRIWEELGMTRRMNELVEAVRRQIGDPRANRNMRLLKVGIGFLAWVANERICITTLLRRLDVDVDPVTQEPVNLRQTAPEEVVDSGPKTLQRRKSVWDAFKREKKTEEEDRATKRGFGRGRKTEPEGVIDIVGDVFQNMWNDDKTITECFALLNGLVFCAFGNPDLCALLADVPIYRKIKDFMDSLDGTKTNAYWIMSLRNYKRFLMTQGSFVPKEDGMGMLSDVEVSPINEPATSRLTSRAEKGSAKRAFKEKDIRVMHNLLLPDYPFALTDWHVDPFPDGIMSLPLDQRAALRKGGRADLYEADGLKYQFFWQSSHDLTSFEWRTLTVEENVKDVEDPTYPYNIAIARIITVTPGTAGSSAFEVAAQKGEPISANRCCVILGPPTPTHTQGVNLSLRFGAASVRDAFIKQVANWREAQAFGFL